MASITMDDPRRKAAFANPTGGYPFTTAAYGHGTPAQALRAAPYLPTSNTMIHHGQGDANIAALAQGLGAMNLQSSYNAPAARGSHVPGAPEYGGVPLSQNPAIYLPNGQQYLYPGNHMIQGAAASHSGGMYTPLGPYMQQPAYGGYGHHPNDHSPNSQGWASRVTSDGSHTMPTLITPRRDSISSNEEHLPGTPFTGVHGYGFGTGVAVFDRSPSGHYTHSGTPSPSPFMPPYPMKHAGKTPSTSTTPLALQLLVQQDPPIPRAIPAPSSPMKPLDRCLENKNGETNVYIRGLLPETTDEMLRSWGARFGDIVSSKSIIDHKTDLCKGFGFIKYHNFDDAENCIRGFHYLGYETSFARESFYAKLKKFSDETNTNLYVSNIPKNMNEHELNNCFAPYKVCSAKILRDESGMGRGVGFARFDTRDICEEVIRKFNNTTIHREGGEDHVIQIRYSDTTEQKMLKQQTAAARQFRAAEFEYGCMQAGRGHLLQPPTERLHSMSPATTSDVSHAAADFDRYGTGNSLYKSNSPLASRSAYLTARPTLPTIKSEHEDPAPHAKGQTNGDSGVVTDAEAKARPATPLSIQEESSAVSGASADAQKTA